MIKQSLFCIFLLTLPNITMAAETCNCIPASVALDGRASAQELFNAGNCYYVCDKNLAGQYADDECPYKSVIVKDSTVQYCYDGPGYTDPWRTTNDIENCSDIDLQNFKEGKLKSFGSFLVGSGYIFENGVAVAKTPGAYDYQQQYNITHRICKNTKANVPSCPDQYSDAYVPCTNKQIGMGATKCFRKCHANKKGATIMIAECKTGTTPAERNPGWNTSDNKPLYAKCVTNDDKKRDESPLPPPPPSGDNTVQCSDAQIAWLDAIGTKCNNAEIQGFIAIIKSGCANQSITGGAFEETYATQLIQMSARLCPPPPLLSDEQKLCDTIPDAHMIGDVCTCDNADQEVNRAQKRCVESVAARARRDEARRQAEQAASVARIKTIREKIDDASSSLGASVWKNREGNFNTSRLASDSIAGVVLGTAGGANNQPRDKKESDKRRF